MEPTRFEKITNILYELGEPLFRLDQITNAIYKRGVTHYSDIKNIPLFLREKLVATLGDTVTTVSPIHTVKGDAVEKVLFDTQDKQKIESVWMNYTPEFSLPHESVCVSSQSGCALKCSFCYTGTMGLKKNLSADEICDQVLYFRETKNFRGSVSFMGMGEPFANEENVFQAFGMLTNPNMFGFGARKINVSTVGLVPGIARLSQEFPQINLAFSLHTPFEDERLQLMPITKAYPISSVFNALDRHIQLTHRKVFIAYIFLAGVNDADDHANALAALINSRGGYSYLYHVNLIKFHGAGGGLPFKSSSNERIASFMSILTKKHINNTLRQSFGLDINAACGQLCAKSD